MNLDIPIPDALRNRVKRNLHADLVDYRVKRRSEWDGEGYDVLYDVAVLWHQPEEAPAHDWGYHSGVIRHKNGEPITVDVFWGHYRLQEAEARKGFLEKRL